MPHGDTLSRSGPSMTGELAREKSCLLVTISYGEERGNSPDTYRGDQREARLVRNLYHIFLLYTTIASLALFVFPKSISVGAGPRPVSSTRREFDFEREGRKGGCEGENGGIKGAVGRKKEK